MKKRKNLTKLWGQPILIGVLSISGLIAALIGDGLFDFIAWICLLYPLIRLSYHYWSRQGHPNRSRQIMEQPTIEELAYIHKEDQE